MPDYPNGIQAGTLLMLISGLVILDTLGWVAAGQWWFIIKMILEVALVLNGMLVAGQVHSMERQLIWATA